MTILLALFSEMVHAKGEGVKYVKKTVHMVYGCPLSNSLNSFKTLIAMPKFEKKNCFVKIYNFMKPNYPNMTDDFQNSSTFFIARYYAIILLKYIRALLRSDFA